MNEVKCRHNGIVIKPDGIHELAACQYELTQRLKNVTVEILTCPKCGATSIGWYRQEDTEDITGNE